MMKTILASIVMVLALCSCQMASTSPLLTADVAVAPPIALGEIYSKSGRGNGLTVSNEMTMRSKKPPTYDFKGEDGDFEVMFASLGGTRYLAQQYGASNQTYSYTVYDIKDGVATIVTYDEKAMSQHLNRKGIKNTHHTNGDHNIEITGKPSAKAFVAAMREFIDQNGKLAEDPAYWDSTANR